MNLLATSEVVAGVVDEIINADPVIRRIPFVTGFDGTVYTYKRESTLPSGAFYEVEEVLPRGNPVFTSHDVTIKQYGLDSDLPGLYVTKENVNAQRAVNLIKTMKGVMENLGSHMVYANSTVASQFDGLHSLVPTAQTTNEGSSSTGDELSLSNVDITIDLVRSGGIDHMVANRTLLRRITELVRFGWSNGPMRFSTDSFGDRIMDYMGYPIDKSDKVLFTETIASGTFSASTGGVTTSLFMLQYGLPASTKPGIFGISDTGMPQIRPNQPVDGKDVVRDRIVWYLALGLGGTKTVAVIDGITDAAVEAA